MLQYYKKRSGCLIEFAATMVSDGVARTILKTSLKGGPVFRQVGGTAHGRQHLIYGGKIQNTTLPLSVIVFSSLVR